MSAAAFDAGGLGRVRDGGTARHSPHHGGGGEDLRASIALAGRLSLSAATDSAATAAAIGSSWATGGQEPPILLPNGVLKVGGDKGRGSASSSSSSSSSCARTGGGGGSSQNVRNRVPFIGSQTQAVGTYSNVTLYEVRPTKPPYICVHG